MKMKNVAFQVRDAYWRSKARLLINWLLSRLSILVKRVDDVMVNNFDFMTKLFIALLFF